MTTDRLKTDPFLERVLLDTLNQSVEKIYGKGHIRDLLVNPKTESPYRLFNKLFHGGKKSEICGRLVPEISLPLKKISEIREKYLEGKIDPAEIDKLKTLENAYRARLRKKDGRSKDNGPTPKSWSRNSRKQWEDIISEFSIHKNDLKDFRLALEFAHQVIEVTGILYGPIQAKANAWLFAHAMERERDKFPENDQLYYQLLAFVCSRGIYQSYIVEDLRYILIFTDKLDNIRRKCLDSMPEIGYEMAVFYTDRIIHGPNSHFKEESPCSNIINLLQNTPPHIHTMKKWDRHTFFRHLNDEFMARKIGATETIPSRPGISLIKSMSDTVELTKQTGCEECTIGTRLSYALGLAQQGDIFQASSIANEAFDRSLMFGKVNLKTKARAYEVKGLIENITNPGQGNSLIETSIKEYTQIQALFAAWHAQKLLNPL